MNLGLSRAGYHHHGQQEPGGGGTGTGTGARGNEANDYDHDPSSLMMLRPLPPTPTSECSNNNHHNNAKKARGDRPLHNNYYNSAQAPISHQQQQQLSHHHDHHYWKTTTPTTPIDFLEQPNDIDDLRSLVIAHQESLIPSSFASSSRRGGLNGNNSTTASANNSNSSNRKKLQRLHTGHMGEKKDGEDQRQQQQQHVELSELTRTLNQLSVSEREKATFDVHGIAPPLRQEQDDPAMIQRSLDTLDKLIVEQANDHPGLAKALSINPAYIRKERMKFLRADEYDPVKAAERMGGYFDMRLEYFCGSNAEVVDPACSCIARDLTVLDLTEDDIKYWKTGFYQVCREKDRSGRIVCIIFLPICYQLKIPAANMVRINFVMNTILTQNVDVQLSGNVHIAWGVGLGPDSMDYIGKNSNAKKMVEAGKYAPMRGVAKHFCYDDESLHPMFQKYATPMSTFSAVRFRSHFGSLSEVVFNLSTFGISIDSVPISTDGVVQSDFHTSFIESLIQQQRERDVELQRIVGDQRREIQQQQHQQIKHNDFTHEDIDKIIPFDITDRPVTGMGRCCDIQSFGCLQGNSLQDETKDNDGILLDLPVIGVDAFELPDLSRLPVELDRSQIEKINCGTDFVDLEPIHVTDEFSTLRKQKLQTIESTPLRDQAQDFSVGLVGGFLQNQGVTNFMPRIHVHPSQVVANDSVSQNSSENSHARSNNSGNSSNRLSTTLPMDVIFGRGSHNKTNPGNLRLKQLLDERKSEYDQSDRAKKSDIVASIIQQLQRSGTRFVAEAYDGDDNLDGEDVYKANRWIVASNDKVKNKITHDFRNMRRTKKGNKAKG